MEKTKVQELEQQKADMINRYMGLQDQADSLNEEIYHLCCDIEVLNKRIEAAREEELKKQREAQLKAAGNAAMKAQAGGNGGAAGKGNGHR